MDNIKSLVEEFRAIHSIRRDKTDLATVINLCQRAADTLAPLMEPVEIPEETGFVKALRLRQQVLGTVAGAEIIDHVDALRSALERALKSNNYFADHLAHAAQGTMELRQRAEAATARAEASERDAKRYRWLKDRTLVGEDNYPLVSIHYAVDESIRENGWAQIQETGELDSIIDSALDAALAGKDAEQNAAPQSTFNRSGEPDASIGGTAAGAAPGLPEDTQTYLKRKYPEVTEPNKLAYYMEAAELFAQDALRAVKERDEAWAAVRDAPNAARLKDSLPDTVAAVYSWRSKHAATIAAARRGR